MKLNFFIGLLFLSFGVFSQETFHLNGVKDKRNTTYLFKNATVHVDSKNIINNCDILIENEKIMKVGVGVIAPKSAIIYDLKGKHIYPSFIDIFSDYGMPEIKKVKGGGYYETQFKSQKEGAYAWNQALKPEINASEVFKTNAKTAEELRKIGFGSVVSHSFDGIARGTSAFVSLADNTDQEVILKPQISNDFSFDKGTSMQSYPFSLMGCVALLRQTFYDADWYKNGGSKKETNLSLAAMLNNKTLPSVFQARNALELLRANKVANEFNTTFIYKTAGDEYQRLNDIKNTNSFLVVPINFPKVLDVDDPFDAEKVTLTELKHWEMAPSNLAQLAAKNINFSITTADLADKSTFLANLQKAIQFGLDKSTALDALTNAPAKALKIDNYVGTLKPGLLANFIITTDDVFNAKSKIAENWIQGNKYLINDVNIADLAGQYNLNIDGKTGLKMEISGTLEKPNIEITGLDSTKIKTTVTRDNNVINLQFKKNAKDDGQYRLIGYYDGKMITGQGKNNTGDNVIWDATFISTNAVKKDSVTKTETPTMGEMVYPFTAFGKSTLPQKEKILIKNATVWTNEKEGNVITDVLLNNGKIETIAKEIASGDAKVIEGKGKHLTNGIIDEHSHIALFSINEIESVSSEVRQEDAIDPDDIDIYRQLAGGVTTSQLLHGSADCIGGQSAIIKLKWGEMPDKLLIDNAPKFIKFALGENVKRGNAPFKPNRFPATRMGVEQVFIDAFTRAKEYKNNLSVYNSAKNKEGLMAPRRDLELDALVEILENKRFITCHSYVQSEINMLMKLADSLGFKVNTFTHILEGYKVADKMKSRNINASTFSDWWAYKMEVSEAIPYNAAIMTKVGVNTAINSDDAEMARRLNQEAAKTILYGGLTELEAWKLVTLNPAKMLHLEDRLGSIKVGKDADLVLWTDNPLSVYAKPEKTIIEGAIYFDDTKETENINNLNKEKNRIIQKMMLEKSKGAATTKPNAKTKPANIHCDSLLELGGISYEEYESKILNQK